MTTGGRQLYHKLDRYSSSSASVVDWLKVWRSPANRDWLNSSSLTLYRSWNVSGKKRFFYAREHGRLKIRLAVAWQFSVSGWISESGDLWHLTLCLHGFFVLRKHFYCVRVVAPWNSLNLTVNDLNSVKKIRSLVKKSDLTQFLYYV